MMDLVFICHRIDTLSERCENLTADQMKESLDRISKDLKDISLKLAMRSKNVWNLTGVTPEEYDNWYWNVFVKDLLSEDEKKDILKEKS